jgi:hypothetical protein
MATRSTSPFEHRNQQNREVSASVAKAIYARFPCSEEAKKIFSAGQLPPEGKKSEAE